ncbi:hypothetical protein CJ195_17525 [Bacillus sp. UMB0899]|nr:hypothetical protein CJ195_17525 [Bacillus sp. UMB0899]
MKPFINSMVLMLLILLFSTQLTYAEEYHRKGYSEDLYNATQEVTEEQYLKNFMIELFLPHIVKETQRYYNDQAATGIKYDWENKYNVVEVIHQINQEKDNEFYNYVVKFTVIVHNGDIKNYKQFGTDTLTFRVNPFLINHKEIKEQLAIKLVDYKHNEPKSKWTYKLVEIMSARTFLGSKKD